MKVTLKDKRNWIAFMVLMLIIVGGLVWLLDAETNLLELFIVFFTIFMIFSEWVIKD